MSWQCFLLLLFLLIASLWRCQRGHSETSQFLTPLPQTINARGSPRGRPPGPSLSGSAATATVSRAILLAFQRCLPPPRPSSEASDAPRRPLLRRPILVIHDIYTWEVRRRSFRLIIAFFSSAILWHHIAHISGSNPFSCATQLLMWRAMFENAANHEKHQNTRAVHLRPFEWAERL